MRAKKDTTLLASKNEILKKKIISYWQLYLLLLPGIVLTIIYKYIPMYGVQIAFRDYNAANGFFGSTWVGLKWFTKFFTNYKSVEMIKNTIKLSLFSILWTFPIPIILSLIINQVKYTKFKNISETILYAPHFVSIMIVCGMIRVFVSPYGGLLTTISQLLGNEVNISILDQVANFRTIYIGSSIWQDAGWGMIIYTATLSSVDSSLHEAAKIDGANLWKRIWHLDLPALIPMISIQLIMSFGSLMNVGFEKAFLLQTDLNIGASEIIATYVYKQGILKAMYSFSTAVSLFNTVINILLLFLVSKVASKVSEVSFL